MSAIWAWATRLIGGWLPIGTKPFPEWLGKVLWALGLFLVFSFTMDRIFPQKPTTINVGKDGVVQMAEPRDMMGFGCNIMRGYIKSGIKAK